LRPERDTPYARLAARELGTDHVEVVVRDADHLRLAGRARRARDLPSRGQFDTSMLALFEAVRRRSTVALSGEGADEIFGGYPWYHDPEVVNRPTFPWLGDSRLLTGLLRDDVRKRVEPQAVVDELYRSLLADVPRLDGEKGLDARMREVTYLGLQAPLASLLDRKDRMSMAVGLEVRVPFCDHRLVEYLWNVPWSMKVADGREKSLLRAATEGIVPREIRMRPKSGYPASFSPGHRAAVREAVGGLLADDASPLREVLDADRVRQFLDRPPASSVHANSEHQLIPLLEVDAWLRGLGVGLAR
jgi:asparagine synthase (glutamine-hydrolysing)